MHLVAVAWIYVALMMAVAEAMHSQGTVLGGVFTFLLYGVLPLAIVMYLLDSPRRRKARRAAEAAALQGEGAPTPEAPPDQARPPG
jgi:hypothetical protein